MGRLSRLVSELFRRRGGAAITLPQDDKNPAPPITSDDADAQMSEGVQHHMNGELDAAESAYRSVLQRQPEHADALHLLGVVQGQRGDQGEARALIGRALALQPGTPSFLVDMGNAYRADGDVDRAVEFFRQALEVAPDDAGANRSWAYHLLEAGHRQDAIVSLSTALAQDPGNLQDRVNLAKAMAEEGRHEEAIPQFFEALEAAPDLALAHRLLAFSLHRCGQFEQSVYHYEKAVLLDPNDYVCRNDFAVLLQELGSLPAAIENLQAAIELQPDFSGAYVNLGNAFKSQHKLVDARRYYEMALELDPADASALNNLGTVLKDLGQVAEGAQYFRRAMTSRNGFMEAESSLLLSLQYQSGVGLEELRRAHDDWIQRWTGDIMPLPQTFANSPDPHRPLRVGYVSPDLHTHPVGLFLEPVLAACDRSGFHVTCYHDRVAGDQVTERIKSLADEWRAVAGIAHQRLVQIIRDDGIDLLVDLAGHSANNRMQMFAMRAAPVQASWIGYLHSTGLPQMDYLIADDATVPSDSLQKFSERIVRLPECFLCYGLPADTPPVGDVPARRNGYVTFACFNNLAKITDAAIRLWADILERVPGARLLIKSQAFHDAGFRHTYTEKLSRLGIPSTRVALESHAPRNEYFQSYNNVDILLDPFPFSGGTISCDALWMGVPVMTLARDRMASRTTASVLRALELGDLVSASGEAYASKAVALAGNPDRLVSLRAGMRARFEASALGDAGRFTGNLESAYRRMWVEWCNR